MPLQRDEMNQYIDPVSMRVLKMIETQHIKILEREKDNECRIYLYDVGNFWIAFEQSAWQLCRLFPQSCASVIHSKICPFPIVISSVSDACIQSYSRKHIVRTFRDHTILLTSAIPSDQYSQWHRDVVNG